MNRPGQFRLCRKIRNAAIGNALGPSRSGAGYRATQSRRRRGPSRILRMSCPHLEEQLTPSFRNFIAYFVDRRVTMKRRRPNSYKWIAWILCTAFLAMSVVSQASWQCLDGHPCPPGCSMQHQGEVPKGAAPHACCVARPDRPRPGSTACSLCASAAPSHGSSVKRCTSPICVKHLKAKPHVSAPPHFDFVYDFDSTAILLPQPTPLPLLTVSGPIVSSPPRAPPGRAVVCSYSPRGPPALL